MPPAADFATALLPAYGNRDNLGVAREHCETARRPRSSRARRLRGAHDSPPGRRRPGGSRPQDHRRSARETPASSAAGRGRLVIGCVRFASAWLLAAPHLLSRPRPSHPWRRAGDGARSGPATSRCRLGAWHRRPTTWTVAGAAHLTGRGSVRPSLACTDPRTTGVWWHLPSCLGLRRRCSRPGRLLRRSSPWLRLRASGPRTGGTAARRRSPGIRRRRPSGFRSRP